MNRKIFRAENIQQAIANIKEELGSDAMILGTRKISKKPLDPYAKIMFEVEAGIPQAKNVKSNLKSNLNLNLNLNQDDWVHSLKEDIADIKDMISIAGFGNGMHNMVCNHFESVGVLASLLRVGVSEKLASTLIQKASGLMDETADQGSKIKSLKKYVMHQCLNQIATKDFFNRDNNSGVPHVAAFVGPTGVGKTTTIAKLAAMLSFQRKMKVGLISIDNYRVGAFEQLKAGTHNKPMIEAYALSCSNAPTR